MSTKYRIISFNRHTQQRIVGPAIYESYRSAQNDADNMGRMYPDTSYWVEEVSGEPAS